MRLIDADALPIRTCYEDCEALEVIDNAPTIDAVPVVRCKDCKEFRTGTAMTFTEKGKHVRYCSCDKLGRLMRDDDFCSYGEPKDGDGNGPA